MKRVRSCTSKFWIVNNAGMIIFFKDGPSAPVPVLGMFSKLYYPGRLWDTCASEFRQNFKTRISKKPFRVKVTIERLADR